MLRKLLKYDLKAVFRLWWAAAAVSVIMAVVGGFANAILNADRDLPMAVRTIASMVQFLARFSFIAFFLVMLVMIFVRYYRNFFTDEGYLTFTLPVSRKALLNSKALMGVIALGATAGVCSADLALMAFIGDRDYYLSEKFRNDAARFFKEMFESIGGYSFLYALEIAVLGAAVLLFTVLFLYTCVTFASMIVKKGKLIAAIGIYYGANSLFSFIIQMMVLFVVPSIMVWTNGLSDQMSCPVAALMLLLLICYVGMFCGILYTLTYRMLDRKLNLS